MKWVIFDTTSNTGAEYIDCDGENCVLEENAEKFGTEDAARNAIIQRGWGEWATPYRLD